MSAPTVSDKDRAACFKEISVRMRSGRVERVRVFPMPIREMVSMNSAKMTTHLMYKFLGIALQRNAPFVLKIEPESYQDVFTVTVGLMANGLEDMARQAMINAAQTVMNKAVGASQ